jgi:hypothetical protein
VNVSFSLSYLAAFLILGVLAIEIIPALSRVTFRRKATEGFCLDAASFRQHSLHVTELSRMVERNRHEQPMGPPGRVDDLCYVDFNNVFTRNVF